MKRISGISKNALVRANYSNFEKDIYETTEYLEKFFSNIILNSNYELKNRYLHIDYSQSAKMALWNGTLDEEKILSY